MSKFENISALIGANSILDVLMIIMDSAIEIISNNLTKNIEISSNDLMIEITRLSEKEFELRGKEFIDNLRAYFTEYNRIDIFLLAKAFYYYRNKLNQLELMDNRKNPKEWEKPYVNAKNKLQSLFENMDTEHEQKLKEAFNLIEDEIEYQSKTKRDIQHEANHKIDYYLNKIENKKISNNKMKEEFKILSEILKQ